MKELIARLREIKNRWADEGDVASEAADALEAQQAEIEVLRAVLDAAVNLVNVKGRHHSEQAYKRLEETVNAARRK